MPTFAEAEAALKARGYTDANVEEKLAQDILLAAFARSGYRAQLAIKGGVVMAALSGDIRRTTLDLDVDFVRRSIDNDSIRALVRDLDGGVEGISVSLVGYIVELRQQDYRGKRVFLSLQDETGDTIQPK
ncbi:MAG: nucleotidyl transferase AbiEii/AbiGii toxin family protein [Kiritimatiellae bacterium]|nr:nucleotidyl transferase AbiEii/AbiGii toxin family protein [Kiritimatiellia bacterium]